MNPVDWTTAPGVWPEIGPEIAATLKRIATMPLDELRAMPELPMRARLYAPSIADVQSVVCEEFAVTRAEMLSPIQTKEITTPRQIAMYLACELTHKTKATIARHFNRDDTVVGHAYRVVQKRPELSPVIARLRAELAP